MAIFKRKRDARTATPPPEPSGDAAVAQPQVEEEEPTASVGISVSSYGGFGATSRATAPAAQPAPADASEADASETVPAAPRRSVLGREVAPPASETVAGLRDNVLLRDALAGLPATPSNVDLAAVARNLLQGHVFLRVKGDARSLLSEGKDLPLAVASQGDQQYVLVYSSGAALAASVKADGDTDTSAMGQPVLTVLKYVLGGSYAGLIVDSASAPARAVYPRTLLERMVDAADPALEIKTLLAGERTAETPARVADALTRAKFWLAVNAAAGGRPGVAEARLEDGSRFIEVYSHPLEVVAMDRGDQPAPMTIEQLSAALRTDEGLSGVIVDAGGPWIRLTRDDLAPLLAS